MIPSNRILRVYTNINMLNFLEDIRVIDSRAILIQVSNENFHIRMIFKSKNVENVRPVNTI